MSKNVDIIQKVIPRIPWGQNFLTLLLTLSLSWLLPYR